MIQDKCILAIFDFDGTLTEGHLWKGIALYNRTKKYKVGYFWLYLAAHLPGWLLTKIGLYSAEKNRISWGRALAQFFKNLDLRQLFQAADAP